MFLYLHEITFVNPCLSAINFLYLIAEFFLIVGFVFLVIFQMTFGQQNTEKEAHEILSYSFDHGINILDTAELVSLSLSLSV